MHKTRQNRIRALFITLLIVVGACADSGFEGQLPGGIGGGERFSLGGEVKGLTSGELVLDESGNQSLSIAGNGPFQFPEELQDGSHYNVTVAQHPAGHFCEVGNAQGTIDEADVDDIEIECFSELALKTVSDIMQLHIAWDGPETVDLFYSSDPECDWDNHSLCEDAGSVMGVTGGRHTMTAVGDGLDPDTGWFFVVEADGLRSPMEAARPTAPVVFGDIYDMLVHEGLLYIGGRFNHVLPSTGDGSAFDLDNGKLTGTLPVVDNTIRAVVADGEGGWFIGGFFDQVDGQPRQRLARIDRHGVLDSDWTPAVNGSIRTMKRHGDTLYVGGLFQGINGTPRNNLAALDADTGELLDWSASVDSSVHSFAIDGDRVFVGGFFTEAFTASGTVDRERLAAFDADSGALLSWNPGANAVVETLIVHKGRLYAGGDFTSIGGGLRTRLAAIATDSDDLLSWDPAADDRVRSLTATGGRIYAAGDFTLTGGGTIAGGSTVLSNDPVTRGHIAAYDADTGQVLDWAPEIDRPVHSITMHNDVVYAGGAFQRVNGQDRQRLAAISRNDASLLDWQAGADFRVESFAISGDRMYVGSWAGGEPRETLAAFDAETGVLTDWNPGTSSVVFAMSALDDVLYVGGNFSHAGGERRVNLAALELETGDALDWEAEIDCCVLDVLAVPTPEAPTTRLYVAGTFTEAEDSAGTQTRVSLAAFDGNGGAMLDWNPGTNEPAETLATNGELIYVGGDFTQVGSVDRHFLAAVDRLSGAVDDWDPGADGIVNSFSIHDGRLYAGGLFAEAGGGSGDNPIREAREHVAAFDLTTGELDDWDAAVDGFSISGLSNDGEHLFIAGTFSALGDDPRENAGATDLNQGAAGNWNPNIDAHFTQVVRVADGRVYLAGSILSAEGKARHGLVVTDAETGELIW